MHYDDFVTCDTNGNPRHSTNRPLELSMSRDEFLRYYEYWYRKSVDTEFIEQINSRDKLIRLATHWHNVLLDIQHHWLYTGEASGSANRRGWYAQQVLEAIHDRLGDEEFGKAIEAAETEFAQRLGPEVWNIVCNSTPEQQRAFQDELLAGTNETNGA